MVHSCISRIYKRHIKLSIQTQIGASQPAFCRHPKTSNAFRHLPSARCISVASAGRCCITKGDFVSNRFHFTSKSVSSARAAKGTTYYYDTEERGLTLVVTPRGTKTFYYTGRVDGRSQRIPAGRFPDVSVERARTNVLRIRAAAAEGRNPREAVAVARRRSLGVTLGQFWEIYLDDYGRMHRKNWRNDGKMLEKHCRHLMQVPLRAITPDAVRELHAALGRETGKPLANKAVNLLRAVYAKAVVWKDPTGEPYATGNPAATNAVDRFPEGSRDRYLLSSEAPGFFKALAETEPHGARHFFQLALYTAARRDNLKMMHTSDIDLISKVWTIPAGQFKKTKAGPRPHPIPLIDRAVDLIELRREVQGDGWLFPGHRKGAHISNVNYWWDDLKERGGVDDMRIHDLRRTTASYMAITGASIPTIAQLLGHTLPGVTPTYARLALDSVRSALDTAISHLLEVGDVD